MMTTGHHSSDPAFLAAYGDAIADLRASRRMDRKQLAEAASISYSYLSAIESGQKIPSPKLEAAIAAALGVPASEILALANGALAEDNRQQTTDDRPNALEVAAIRMDTDAVASYSMAMPASPMHRPPEPEPSSGGLSPPAALAELRVLLQHMSPEDSAMVVSMARRLSGQTSRSDDSPPQRQSGSYRGRQGRELRTSAYLRFWTDYMTKVTNRGLDWVDGRQPEPRSYFTMASPIKGASISASFARNRLLRHELYINRGSRDANLELLRQLNASRRRIETTYGRSLEFEDPGRERRAVRIAEYREGHISRTDEYGDYIEWFIDAGLRLRRSIDGYLEGVSVP
jgi:transcriptional regulator with XRE-family HTH domain